MHRKNGNVVMLPTFVSFSAPYISCKVIVGLKLICSCLGFTNTLLRVQTEILDGLGYRLYSVIKSFYQSKRCGL